MKKISFLFAFLALCATASFAARDIKNTKNSIIKKESIPKNEQNSYRTLPGDMYYILHNDGCYHLGIEIEEADGSVWWTPVGFEYGYDWCCNNTICMGVEEFANLC